MAISKRIYPQPSPSVNGTRQILPPTQSKLTDFFSFFLNWPTDTTTKYGSNRGLNLPRVAKDAARQSARHEHIHVQ